mmetsp:Transcript_6649/g.16276  ORF Transcript_6649/g.16276 Transcript_6649/m.16276 type:complete len:588 (+) Transcript_6649:32-1795(+)
MQFGLPDRSFSEKASLLRGGLPRRGGLLGEGALAYKQARGLHGHHAQASQQPRVALTRQRSAPSLAHRPGAYGRGDGFERLAARMSELGQDASLDRSHPPRPDSGMRRSSSATTLGRSAWEGAGGGVSRHAAPLEKWSSSLRLSGSPVAPLRPNSRSSLQKRVGGTPDMANMSSSLLGGRPGSHYASRSGGLGFSESTMLPPDESLLDARVQKYSDLFDEVIQRDRIFGSLLGKIKLAYDEALKDALLNGSQQVQQRAPRPGKVHQAPVVHQQPPGMPTPPGQAVKQNRYAPQVSHAPAPGGVACSDEPTRRAQKDGLQELQHENRVLKDLIERLHMELEAAMQRERNWKDRAQKHRPTQSHTAQEAAYMEEAMHVQQHSSMQHMLQGQPREPYPSHVAHYELSPECQANMLPRPQMPQQPLPASRTFNAAMREPDAAMRFQDGSHWNLMAAEEKHSLSLNQGGILSISSISQHTSPQYAAMDSARSDDSGMLPQCPTRRQVVKPAHVPTLDLSKVPCPQEDEEEEVEGEVQDEMEWREEDAQDILYSGDAYAAEEIYGQEVYEQDSYDSIMDPRALAFGHEDEQEC